MPYNFLVDKKIRDSFQLSLQDKIIIIDEAHNITNAAENAMEFEVSSFDLKEALREFNYIGSNDLVKYFEIMISSFNESLKCQ
jgi:Rad3-related DNA helicase